MFNYLTALERSICLYLMKGLLFSVFCHFEILVKYFLFSLSDTLIFQCNMSNTLALYLCLSLYINMHFKIHFQIHFEIIRCLICHSGDLGKLLGDNKRVNCYLPFYHQS